MFATGRYLRNSNHFYHSRDVCVGPRSGSFNDLADCLVLLYSNKGQRRSAKKPGMNGGTLLSNEKRCESRTDCIMSWSGPL